MLLVRLLPMNRFLMRLLPIPLLLMRLLPMKLFLRHDTNNNAHSVGSS